MPVQLAIIEILSGQETPRPQTSETSVPFIEKATGKPVRFTEVPTVVISECCNPARSTRPILNATIKSVAVDHFVVCHTSFSKVGGEPDLPTFNWIATYTR